MGYKKTAHYGTGPPSTTTTQQVITEKTSTASPAHPTKHTTTDK